MDNSIFHPRWGTDHLHTARSSLQVTIFPSSMRRRIPILVACLCAAGAALASANAAIAATAPDPGAAYREGPSGRFMLDGKWLHRADPADNGVTAGFQKQTSTDGWAPTTIPNASNAGDFSVSPATSARCTGIARTSSCRGAPRPRTTTSSASSRSTTGPRRWLNGKPIGFNVGAYLPFEFRAKGIKKGTNSLVVQVDSRRQPFDIPPLSQRSTGNFEGGWWNYNGILREVYLRQVEEPRRRGGAGGADRALSQAQRLPSVDQGRGQGSKSRPRRTHGEHQRLASATRASTSSVRSGSPGTASRSSRQR